MHYSKLIGWGSYLPEKVLTNKDLEKIVNTTDDWIVSRTGIKQRHVAHPEQGACDMAEQAAQKAIAQAGIDANEIDLIILATSTPDRFFPSTACLLQARLGISGAPAFDISAACSGFIYALSVADNFIKSGQYRCALVVGSEVLSRMIDWEDRKTCVLFGDGAGAVVIKSDNEPGIYTTQLHADGKYNNLLYVNNGLATQDEVSRKPHILMKGAEVFKTAVRTLGSLTEETIVASGFKTSDINWLIPHQANLRIITAMAEQLNMSLEQVVVTVDQHGNTSAASIPLALDYAINSGKIKVGDNLLLEAFGGGFAWGSALLKFT